MFDFIGENTRADDEARWIRRSMTQLLRYLRVNKDAEFLVTTIRSNSYEAAENLALKKLRAKSGDELTDVHIFYYRVDGKHIEFVVYGKRVIK